LLARFDAKASAIISPLSFAMSEPWELPGRTRVTGPPSQARYQDLALPDGVRIRQGRLPCRKLAGEHASGSPAPEWSAFLPSWCCHHSADASALSPLPARNALAEREERAGPAPTAEKSVTL